MFAELVPSRQPTDITPSRIMSPEYYVTMAKRRPDDRIDVSTRIMSSPSRFAVVDELKAEAEKYGDVIIRLDVVRLV